MNTYLEKVISIANQNKYTKYYSRIIESALTRPQDRKHLKEIFGYVESHHILPESFGLGGEKDKENLVFLTAKEHFIVHLCAIKMFESILKQKMIFAFRRLRAKNPHQQGRYINSRLYSLIKPNFKTYVRLYNKEKRAMLHESKISEIAELENQGWSRKMTQEYKDSSMKCMKGKKHSDETKVKMSASQKGIPKLKLRGVKKSPESVKKQKETIKKNKEENPEKYQKTIDARSLKMKAKYEKGELSMSGENNGMFGKHHSDNTKNKIREKHKQYWESIDKNSPEHMEYLARVSSTHKERWKNPEFKERASLFNSTAYKKYNLLPQEFYDQKLKPLLYMGFLPAAMVRYKLIDLSKNYIKILIKEWGTNEDLAQFEENRRKGAGANKAYIQFQEDQYNKYFKDKSQMIL